MPLSRSSFSQRYSASISKASISAYFTFQTIYFYCNLVVIKMFTYKVQFYLLEIVSSSNVLIILSYFSTTYFFKLVKKIIYLFCTSSSYFLVLFLKFLIGIINIRKRASRKRTRRTNSPKRIIVITTAMGCFTSRCITAKFKSCRINTIHQY